MPRLDGEGLSALRLLAERGLKIARALDRVDVGEVQRPDLVAAVAEHVGEGVAEFDDNAVEIVDIDAVDGGIEQRPKTLLVRQPGRCPSPADEVPNVRRTPTARPMLDLDAGSAARPCAGSAAPPGSAFSFAGGQTAHIMVGSRGRPAQGGSTSISRSSSRV